MAAHPKDQHQPQGSPGFKGWGRIQALEVRAFAPVSFFWQPHPHVLTFNQMEGTSRQWDGNARSLSVLLLARLIWIKRDQCFPGWLSTLTHCVGVPAMAEQSAMKPPHLFQLHEEASSSLPCHMALLLIPWKRQRCWGWTRGFGSLKISPARAYAEVLALT